MKNILENKLNGIYPGALFFFVFMMTIAALCGAAQAAPLVPIIDTVAGTGTLGYNGDDQPATAAQLAFPNGVFVTAAGDLFIADFANHRIRRVYGVTGVITTVAGTDQGFSGDGGLAADAQLDTPFGVFVTGADDLFIADFANHRIRRVDGDTGVITTVAGTGTAGFNGDIQPATAAQLRFPNDVFVTGAGDLYIADRLNDRIRRVDGVTGVITTVAGTGAPGFSGDGGLATAAQLAEPTGVFVTGAGDLYIADRLNHRIRRVDGNTSVIITVAGTGVAGFSGDGGQATAAKLFGPQSVFVTGAGDLIIADMLNHRIRRVDGVTGVITTVAGTGAWGFSGDGGLATAAKLMNPHGVFVTELGDLYISDTLNHRIRLVANLFAAPQILSLETNEAGTAVRVEFNTLMANPALVTSGGFSVSHGGAVTAVDRDPSDDTVLVLTLDGENTAADEVTLSYTHDGVNDIKTNSGGVLENFGPLAVTNLVPPLVTQAVTNLNGTQILVGFNAPIVTEGAINAAFLDQFDVSVAGITFQTFGTFITNFAPLDFYTLFLSVDPAFTPVDGDFELTYTPGGNRLRLEDGGPEVLTFTVTVENLVRTFSAVTADDVLDANTSVDIELTIVGSLLGGESIAIEGMDALHPWIAGGDLETADFSAVTTSGSISSWDYDAGTGVLTVVAGSVMSKGAVITVTIDLTGEKTWVVAPGAVIEETLTATRSDNTDSGDVTFTITNLVPPKPLSAETNGTGIEVYVQFDALIESQDAIDESFIAQFDTGGAGINFLVAGTQISGNNLTLAVDGAVTPEDGDFDLTYTPGGNRLRLQGDGPAVKPFTITVENKVATLDPITVNTVLDADTTIDIELTVKHFFSFMFTIEGLDALHPWIAGGVLESTDFGLDKIGDVDYDATTGVLSIDSELVFDGDSITVSINLAGGKTWVAAPGMVIEETLTATRETTPSGDALFTITNAIPGFVSAQTNLEGDEVRVTFNQDMADQPFIGSGGFTVSPHGDVTAVFRDPGDESVLVLSISDVFTAADDITVSYDGTGGILSDLDGVLQSFTSRPVTNQVPAVIIAVPNAFTITEGQSQTIAVTAYDHVEIDALTTVVDGFSSGSLILNASGAPGRTLSATFTFSPGFEDAGVGTIEFIATNIALDASSVVVDVTVETAVWNLSLHEPENGAISTVPAGVTSFVSGESVELEAIPDLGYGFVAWLLTPDSSGEIVGNTYTGGIGDATISAEFTLIPWILVLEQAPGGTISTVPAGITSFVSGETVALTATPDPGYAFVGWSIRPGFEGEIVDDTFIGGPGNAVLDVEFAPIGWSLTLLEPENGIISTVPAGITTFASNAEVILAATPDVGYAFAGWSLSEDSSGEIVGDTFFGGIGDATIEALIELTPWALELIQTPGGEISTVPAGIVSFVSNAEVILAATPDAGHAFAGWSLSEDSIGEIVGDTFFGGIGDATIEAEFKLAPWTLELIQAPGGEISTIPAGVTSFASGAEVILAATPDTGWVLVDWLLSDDSSGEIVGDSYFGGIGNATISAEFFELPRASSVEVVASLQSAPVNVFNEFTLILLDQYGDPFEALNDMVFEITVVLSGPGDPTLGVSTFGGAAVGIDANTALVTIEAGTFEAKFTFANNWAGSYTLTAKLSQVLSPQNSVQSMEQ